MREGTASRCGGIGRGSGGRALAKRAVALACGLVLAIGLILSFAPAAQAAPVQFFYVPFLESDLLTALQTISGTTTPATPLTNHITITAVGDGTIIYYDQWENGYDVDIANTLDTYSASNLDGTQIWGDNDPANGIPLGLASDVIDAGTVIDLTSVVPIPRVQTDTFFDARDKLAATKTIAMTRTTWASGSTTLLAGCVEMFDTNNWGTDYRMPVGTDLADGTDYQMFEYTALSIMTSEPDTTISLDANGDGDYADAGDLNNLLLATEGSNRYVTGVSAGARVVSDKPVQVDFLTGDIGSNYESRDSALLPYDMWATQYYTPVSTPNVTTNAGDERTTVWLYNPWPTTLTVTYQYRNLAGTLTTATLSIPARGGTNTGVVKQLLDPAVIGPSGATFYASSEFYAFSTTDSASATNDGLVPPSYTANQAWDWGYTMIPRGMLTTQALVGLGLGQDPTISPITENGNPVWVTTVGNGDTSANVYVDFDADPTTGRFYDATNDCYYDAVYSLRELDHALIYVPPTTATGVVWDANSSWGDDTGPAVSTASFNHTTGVAKNRLMLVGVVIGNEVGNVQSVSSVTYAGLPLTYVGGVDAPAGGGGTPNSLTRVELWALANPPAGTASVTVTLTGARVFVAGATTFSGVDVGNGLSSALGSFVSASASSGTGQSVVATTVAGQVVFDVVGACNYGGRDRDPSDFTMGAGQTVRMDNVLGRSNRNNSTARRVRGASSTETATGGSTTMSHTSTTDYPWAIGAIPINPMPAGTKADQTGILVYTTSTSVRLAVAWGQDPQTCSAGAPGLDVGTSIPPMPEFTAGKDGTLYDDPSTPGVIEGDNDDDGYLSPGDEMVYPITVYNVSRLPVPNVYVWDHAPDPTLYDTTYVPNSTLLSKDEDGDGDYDSVTAIPDDASGTAFPLDNGTAPTAGYNVGTLPVNGEYTVTFHVILDEYDDLILDTLAILNGGKATALGWEDPVDDDAYLNGRISNFVWFDDGDGIQEAGEEGVAGVTVQLLDGDGNPVYNTDGSLKTLVTDANGEYDFTGLPADDYIVQFTVPTGTGWEFTGQDLGADDVDSDADPTTSRTAVVTLGGGQTIVEVDAGFKDPTPTLAVVGSFKAYRANGRVVLNWQTTSETGTAGFYVERQVGQGDQWIRVNQDVIPGLFESPSGGSYSVVDAGAKPSRPLTYRLVELETSGELRTHGPYQVTAQTALPSREATSEISRGKQSVRIPKVVQPEAPAEAEAPAGSVAREKASPDRLRLEVMESGLYAVSAADIVTGLGLSEAKVTELIFQGGLKLTSGGEDIAYLQAEDGSGIYFYGQAIDSIYTSANVYWLAQGKGKTIAPVETTSTVTVPAEETTTTAPVETTTTEEMLAVVPAVTSFIDTVHAEQGIFAAPAFFHDPESDFWLWRYMVAGYAGLQTSTASLNAPNALAGLKLRVLLYGLNTSKIANEHQVEVKLNGTTLGHTTWTGKVAQEASFDIPEGLLQAGENTVELTAMRKSGVALSVVALDFVELTYERATTALADQLLLAAPSAGLLQVDGLSSATAWVLDVAAPSAPRALPIAESGGEAGAAWLRFEAVENGQYLVCTADAPLRLQAITATTGTNLRSKRAANYVIITATELSGAARVLANYRATQGLKTTVVTLGEIYDEFNYGVANPHAIQSFLKYALATWKPGPKYLVLAGEGSYDYTDYLGAGDCVVPSLMVDTEYGLASSDVLLGDTVGSDGVPEVAVGRILAFDKTELAAAINKIKRYEATSGAWRRSAVFVADNGDEGGAFAADSDSLAALLPSSFRISKAYLDSMTPADARALLLGGFTSGVLLVNYTGHAGADQLATEGLLTGADALKLKATGYRLPVVTAYSCVAGSYALPNCAGLGETLVKRADAGAIAMWAPSAMAENSDSVQLGRFFTQRLFRARTSTVVLGDAILAAQKAGAGAGLPTAVIRTYNLLGDPALRVRY